MMLLLRGAITFPSFPKKEIGPAPQYKKPPTATNQKGFTVIELLVVIIASSLIMAVTFNFFWQYWQYAEKSQSDLDVLTSRLDLSDYIRETVGTTSGLIDQNSIADPNANVPDATAGTNYWQAIHPVPGTTTTSSSVDKPILYFRHFSQDKNNNFIMNGANPYEDEYVVYLSKKGELRVRTLANSSASGNALITSCPPAAATSSCPPDKLLIDGLSSVAVRYFSRSGNLLDYTPTYDSSTGTYVNGPDFPAVEVIEYTVNISKTPATQTANTTQSSTVIRVALRNT
jgi:prepilin-type N-terminal cleavage/methylation domain-containing protein